MIHFITFSANNYSNTLPEIHKAAERIKKQAKNSNVFDTVAGYTDIDLQTDSYFWSRHQEFIKNNQRGYGSWLWKPYIIKKHLEQIAEGDILVYADCGCEILSNSNTSKNNFILEIQTKQLVAFGSNIEQHCKHFTKQICYNFFNAREVELLENGFYYEANRIFLVKNKLICNFIDEWWSVMNLHYNLYDGSKTEVPEKASFFQTRDDQMIFNFILFKNKLLSSERQYKNSANLQFAALRNKTGRSNLCKNADNCSCCVI